MSWQILKFDSLHVPLVALPFFVVVADDDDAGAAAVGLSPISHTIADY